MIRIFDDPNHPQYGPVRRMWVILAQLAALEEIERIVPSWDQRVALWVKQGYPESEAQTQMLCCLFQKQGRV